MRNAGFLVLTACLSSLLALPETAQRLSQRGERSRGGHRASSLGGGVQGTGSVVASSKISNLEGGVDINWDDLDRFGSAMAPMGDVDGNGVDDVVVGMPGFDTGGLDSGSIWLLFLEADGSVVDQKRIGENANGFVGPLDYTDKFGTSIANLGDVDDDGINDLAVGVPSHDGGPFACGLVKACNYGGYYVLFMNADGTVRDETSLLLQTGFGAGLGLFFETGFSLTGLGDLDGDGVPDLACGAPGSTASGENDGALWIVFQNENGSIRNKVLIAQGSNGFNGVTRPGSRFGSAVTCLGDLDGDGVVDIAVGNEDDPDGGTGTGAVWILFLNTDGTVKAHQKISDIQGGFEGELEFLDHFGSACASPGDLDLDGVPELAVGSFTDDDGGTGEDSNRGALWILFMNADGTVRDELKISDTSGGLEGQVQEGAWFGRAAAGLGDWDGDGVGDLIAGAPKDPDGGFGRGAVFLLSLDGVVNAGFDQLANGEEVASGEKLAGSISIDGFPTQGPSAAAFDSDPNGPNASSTDPDLLVDLGNVLILQELFGQTTPGIYDVPDDDALGGDFVVTFGGEEVRLLSIDFVDLCPQIGQGAIVILMDSKGATRTYAIPSGWTEDVAMDGPPGFGTLDLTTLLDQPGFMGTAVAQQDPGFDSRAVVLMDVSLNGSGAVDNIRYDPHPDIID